MSRLNTLIIFGQLVSHSTSFHGDVGRPRLTFIFLILITDTDSLFYAVGLYKDNR